MMRIRNFVPLFTFILFLLLSPGSSLVSAQTCTDNDGDGYAVEGGTCGQVDCNDNDPDVFPNNIEWCDGKDSNCDGWKPPTDVDNDGDGVPLCANDCNDNDPNRYPGNTEICADGIDNNCNYFVDEPGCVSGGGCTDNDGDGYGVGADCLGPDCDDGNAAINPAATEVCGNVVDENCDGTAETCPADCTDNDGDGYGVGADCLGPDCDDGNAAINPAATEVCGNGVDENCDGTAETCPADCTDNDGDGYGVGVDCLGPDCDDGNAAINPAATEVCGNGVDENCDGTAEICPADCTDNDGDGYGVGADCLGPDCNDGNSAVNPGASDANCNGVDDDCDGTADDNFVVMTTNCGTGACSSTGMLTCSGGSTTDSCTEGTPTNEGPSGDPTCSDMSDNDCDGSTDGADSDCVAAGDDNDGDGFTIAGGDCDDTDPNVFPGAPEICDGKDSNCDFFQPPTDFDNDGDGVAQCAGDCDDNNPDRFPGNLEHPLRSTCGDFIDNDCDGLTDNGDPDCFGNCETASSPKQGPHFFTLLNPDNTVHPDNAALACDKCHGVNFGDPVRYACQRCHADSSDASNPLNGTIKDMYPLDPPYGYGSAPNVELHTTWTMGPEGCVVCHNPHAQEQDNTFGTDYGQYIKDYVCYDPKGIEEFVEFTSPTGQGSFADGAPYTANICDMCHTETNHHQNDGTAPGGQEHNDGTNCTACHPHGAGFAPAIELPPPHNTQVFNDNCDYCHVTPSDFSTPVPDAKCQQCHSPAGTLKAQFPGEFGTAPDVMSHSGRPCIECHNPMFAQTNRKLIRSQIAGSVIPGSNIVFTASSGSGSFADGPPYNENICNTCHTMTNHHQSDGTAPGGQDHNNGANCTACHPHGAGFLPVIELPPPHNTQVFNDNCDYCHVSASDFSTVIPDTKCQQCHSPAGTLKAQFPGEFGTAPDVLAHSGKPCIECHNPMFPQTNIKLVRSNITSSIVPGSNIVFTARSGPGSFADGPPYPENVCDTCHSMTNHHQSDGSAPGGQDHNNGTDCAACHPHGNAFLPSVEPPPAPHANFDCEVCHVTPDTYVFDAIIPNSACQACHDPAAPGNAGGGSNKKALSHFTGMNCVQCHNPMRTQINFRGNVNLSFIKSEVRNNGTVNEVAFEAETGPYSFAADSIIPSDMMTANYICNTCHSFTNHHQADGTAPGGQSHFDGQNCTACHSHIGQFRDQLTNAQVPAPHDVFDCEVCHLTPDTYVPNAFIPNSACQFCHDPAAPGNAGGGSDKKVASHFAGQLCVECHNPMSVQINFRNNENLSFIRSVVQGNDVAFESRSGPYSFAADSIAPADMSTENYICNTCHSFTNHHQADGAAPGGQSHFDGINCTVCHSHLGAFRDQLENTQVPAPHDGFDCEVCHVTPDTYVANALIPNSACLDCHDPGAPGNAGGGSDTKVASHFAAQLCVECHNPMSVQINFRNNENLSFIRSVVRGNDIAFEAKTGPYSFAADMIAPTDMSTVNYICNTCHTFTNHHQADGAAPGGQSHFDGADCTVCHSHLGSFRDQLENTQVPAPHDGFDCEVCHVTPDTYVANAMIPNTACLDCHDPAAPGNGGGGSDAKVVTHFSDTYTDPTTGSLMNADCVECHNPMSEQNNLAFIRSTVRDSEVVFTSYTGMNSFADGDSTYDGICEVCHSQTNHHRNDGSAPAQSHNDGADCRFCHPHIEGFQPNVAVPPPHDGFDCEVCHVTPDTYVPDADIPNSACFSCHDGSQAPPVDTHFSNTYIDPTTAAFMNINCVECHNPMSAQDNLKFIRSMVRDRPVIFTARTGANSFADGGAPYNGICEVCHTQTNHHRNDGSAPMQDHNNGTECTICHDHQGGFQPSGGCTICHSEPQGNRVAVVDQFGADSHHIQGVELMDEHCYQCHWEANSDGSINSAYHGGWDNPGSEVNLVIYGNGSRPTTYSSGNTAVEYTAGGGTGGDPGSDPPTVNPNGTYIEAENYTGTIGGSSRTFDERTSQSGFLGDSYLQSIGGTTGSCPPSSGSEGKEYEVNFTATGNYNIWIRGYASGGSANSIFIGLDGDCVGSLRETSYGNWTWTRSIQNGSNRLNVSTPGTHKINVWIREANHRLDGIYLDMTGNTPTDSSHGVEIDPTSSGGGGVSGERAELMKINKVCLGCHSAQNNSIQPFGDGKTPREYAWDGRSIDERYSQTGSTPWGKYSDTSSTDITPKNTQTKAYSAHGNAAVNERGWNLSETWPDTSGSVNVVCFDCHNSHGSTASGTTASYPSATASGAILKDTIAGKGGFSVTYKPQAGGSEANNNAREAGASLCFDCHMNADANATPWGYNETFGAQQEILGYRDTAYFGPGLAGAQLRFPYRQALQQEGGHFGASMDLTTQVMGTIDGLCTPCHDPHGVSPSLGSNQQYGVPLLKGSWLTSPYKEDVPPATINDCRGTTGEDGDWPAFCGSSTPGYHIDQNTFANWDFNSTASVNENASQFAGLCMQCHPQSSINPNTDSSWRSVDRIHNSVKGWDNDGNTKHRYTCSKCHTPHNAALGRLVITNCLDSAHRGRVETGGRANRASVNGDEGDGSGGHPAGGGGRGDEWRFTYFFGTNSGGRDCHDNTNNDSFPDDQLWNVVSPWGQLGAPGDGNCSSRGSASSCLSSPYCAWDDERGDCVDKDGGSSGGGGWGGSGGGGW